MFAAVGRDGNSGEVLERIRDPGLQARCPIRHAEPQPVQRGRLWEERFVRDEPGQRGLGVCHGTQVLPERAVLVAPHRTRNEESVVQPDHLLDIRADSDRLTRRVKGVPQRCTPDGQSPGGQELARRLISVQEVVEILHAHRGLGADSRRELERGGARRVRRPAEEAIPVVVREPQPQVGEVGPFAEALDVALHALRDVGAGRRPTREPRQRAPVRRNAAREALHILRREHLERPTRPRVETVGWDVGRIVPQPAARVPVRDDSQHVVVVLGQPQPARHIAGRDGDVGLVRQLGRDVGA